jgi:hypothetical protein
MSRLSVAGTTEAGGADGTVKVTPEHTKKNLHSCIRVHLLTGGKRPVSRDRRDTYVMQITSCIQRF